MQPELAAKVKMGEWLKIRVELYGLRDELNAETVLWVRSCLLACSFRGACFSGLRHGKTSGHVFNKLHFTEAQG